MDAQNNHPNVIMIFPDQWRGDCLSYLGNPDVETPNLDALCYEGVVFEKCYSPVPTCIAARACMITGMDPDSTGRHGYRDGVPWNYPVTLMTQFRDAGYQTINSGKTHFFPDRANLGFEVNHLYAHEMHAQKFDPDFRCDYHDYLRKETGGEVRDTVDEMSSNGWYTKVWPHAEHLHPSAWTTSMAIESIEKRDPTRPFFLNLGYHRPHPPYDPPQTFWDIYKDKELAPSPIGDWAEEYDIPMQQMDGQYGRLPEGMLDRTKKGYYASISFLDYQIGRLIYFLKLKGLYENTIILFSSDHGEMLGDHHHFKKLVPFEGSSRVPLVIKPTGKNYSHASRRTSTLANLCDLMPSLLDGAGIELPEHLDGISLWNEVESGEDDSRDYLHGEHAPSWHYVVTENFKYIWHSNSGKEYFFDLKNDPSEMTNAIDNPQWQSVVDEMRHQLIKKLKGRPEDGMISDGKLSPGNTTPAVRPWLLARQQKGEPSL